MGFLRLVKAFLRYSDIASGNDQASAQGHDVDGKESSGDELPGSNLGAEVSEEERRLDEIAIEHERQRHTSTRH